MDVVTALKQRRAVKTYNAHIIMQTSCNIQNKCFMSVIDKHQNGVVKNRFIV